MRSWPPTGPSCPRATCSPTSSTACRSTWPRRRSRSHLAWANSNLLGVDVPTAIKELKEEDGGNIVVLGSGNLVQTLIEHDLIDEYALMIHPLVLGTGKKLFEEGLDKVSLRLLDSMTTTTGVVFASYAPEGR